MPRRTTKLTRATLDKLRARAQAEHGFTAYLADAGQPGLYVQARRGRLRFVFDFRPPAGGARRRMQLDDFGAITLEQARHLAGELRGKVAGGRDPQAEREQAAREATTFAAVAASYLEDLRERAESGARRGKRSGYTSARQLLAIYVLPKIGPVPIRQVSAEQVRRLHRAMKGTPGAANRALTVISAVFGYADRLELVPPRFNPCRFVERFEEKGERRALTVAELGRLGQAIREAEQEAGIHPSGLLAIRLLALSGFRLSEVTGHVASDRRGPREGLRWGDCDLDRGLVTLPATKTGRQTRVLGAAALALLKAAKPAGAQPGDCVVPATGRRGGRQRGAGIVPSKPFVGVDRVRRKLYQAAGLDGLPGVDLHSLRHSFATTAAHLHDGRYAGLVSALLGHGYQKRAVTDRYVSGDPEALRPAADAVAGAIAAALGLGERGQVVQFRGSRRD